ncbi:Tyrosine recombinase XerC [Clostridium felsineum DSM 794]|nr:Tyrosine recombinase XerC [Clostridium felsineum DSM 794]
MKGGVRKRGKSWSYYFYIGEISGKKKMKEKGGFQSKSTAEKAMRNALYEFEHGGYVEPKKITLNEFSLEWLNKYVKPLRKISTYNRYKELVNKYLIPTLGTINIINITSYHIEQLLLANKKNISSSTLQSIYTIINTIMNRALKLKIIKENPCKYVDRPKRKKFTPDVLEPNEIQEIFKILDLSDEYDYMFNVALRLVLELGLRRGELAGLEWSSINYIEHVLIIKNNLIYTNGHVKMTTPKTQESNRIIYVSDSILDLLKDLHNKQLQHKIAAQEFYEDNIFDGKKYDLIMKWCSGKYIHPMFYTNKIRKVLKLAKINKAIRFHDLRHTNATLLLEQGINLKVIQERLGHKDISTTANIYSHVNKTMQKDATEKLLTLFKNY